MKRHLLFLLSVILSLIVFYEPIKQLMVLSIRDALFYSHIPLIPFVSGFFLYWDRREIFSHIEYSVPSGLSFTMIGVAVGVVGLTSSANLNKYDFLSLLTLSALITWVGIFILFYGFHTFKRAIFPLLFLLFIVPLPSLLMKIVLHFVQQSSVEIADVLFNLIGVPAVRDGYVFHLPGLSTEVAEECSGMRSSIALVITSVIACKLLLCKGWTRSLLMIFVVPIAILKNGIRIVTLSVFGAYVDMGIMKNLHSKGGILFFSVSLIILWGVVILLRRLETSHQPSRPSDGLSSQHEQGLATKKMV